MRYIFWFWLVPMSIIWIWFGLSYYDINFGFTFLSREAHDFVFFVYSHFTGIEQDQLVRLLVKACIVDSLLIFAIYGFRRRKDIRAWWAARQPKKDDVTESQSAPSPAE
ncbi:MAG: DUF6105 family protein [Pseudomonadota bacterium]